MILRAAVPPRRWSLFWQLFDVDDPPSSCSPAMVILRPRPSKYLQLVTRTASDIVVKTFSPNTQSSDSFWLFIEYIYKLITTKTMKNYSQYLRTENKRSSTRCYYYYICQIISKSTSRRLGLLLPLYLTPFRHLPPFFLFNSPVSHDTHHVPFFLVLTAELTIIKNFFPPLAFSSITLGVTWHPNYTIWK